LNLGFGGILRYPAQQESTIGFKPYFPAGVDIFNSIRNSGVALTSDSSTGGLWAKDWNNFGPKLGFAWDHVWEWQNRAFAAVTALLMSGTLGNVTFTNQNPPNYAGHFDH